ncbi:MAG: zf-TFIIB domain-containing protein [Acidobacteriota bacterium]
MKTRALLCPSCGGPLDPEGRACPQCGTTVATRRCGVCFGMNLVDSHNCRRCGRVLPHEDTARGAERRPCAGCGASMTPRELDNTRFDECDHCGGLWLSPSAVSAMRSQAEARSRLRPFDLVPRRTRKDRSRPAVQYRKCPVCSKYMNRANYAHGSGVIVDVCKDHGSYFDPGELTSICRFIESGGLEKMRRREQARRRALQSDERRKAIMVGAQDPARPIPEDLLGSWRGLDLLGWLADLF